MSSYWDTYFDEVCRTGPSWMDYSNERVHLQTLGAVVEASDALIGKRCLDIGCGRGQLSRMLLDLGARQVIGVDRVSSSIEARRIEEPRIEWRVADVAESQVRDSLGVFDRIYLLEVMQYMKVPTILDGVWQMLSPGGRIVAMFPHEACPIVRRTAARFPGTFIAPPLAALRAWIEGTPSLDTFAARGLTFQPDQRNVPYALSPWSQDLAWSEPPNRVQLVVQKRAG